MPTTVLTGLVDTNDALSNELAVDMSNEIAMLHADEDQFFTLLNKLPKLEAKREQVNWLEDQLFPRYTTSSASATSAATTVSVATGTGAYFRANDLFRVPSSGEMVKVGAVSTDDLTGCTRSIGGTAAATIAASADLVIVGNASAQGATLGTAQITKKVLGYNYTQIIRTPFRFTKTNLWVDRYGPNEPGREAGKKLVEHRRQIEYTVFWGGRDFETGGATPVGYAGGIDEYISTNVHSVAGALTNTGLDGYLRTDLQNTKQPAIFAAPVPAQAVSNFLRAVWAPNTTGDRVYGAKVDYWLDSAYGMRTPVFVKRDWNDFASTNNSYGSRMYVADLANVKLRPAPPLMGEPRFAALLKDRQANDADEQAMEYLSEFSLEVRHETHFARIHGITG